MTDNVTHNTNRNVRFVNQVIFTDFNLKVECNGCVGTVFTKFKEPGSHMNNKNLEGEYHGKNIDCVLFLKCGFPIKMSCLWQEENDDHILKLKCNKYIVYKHDLDYGCEQIDKFTPFFTFLRDHIFKLTYKVNQNEIPKEINLEKVRDTLLHCFLSEVIQINPENWRGFLFCPNTSPFYSGNWA